MVHKRRSQIRRKTTLGVKLREILSRKPRRRVRRSHRKIKLGLLPRKKCQFFGRNKFRFGDSSMVTQIPSTSAPMIPAEYGPGYDANSQQSYPNMLTPYYGQSVPWVQPSNWWYPVGNGQVQAPEMTIH